jgi:hypothetical protein
MESIIENHYVRAFEHYYSALYYYPDYKNNDIMWANLGFLLTKDEVVKNIVIVNKLFPDIGVELTKPEMICYCLVNSLIFNPTNHRIWNKLAASLYSNNIDAPRFLQLIRCRVLFTEYLILNKDADYISLCIYCTFQALKIKQDEETWWILGKLYEKQIFNKNRISIVDFYLLIPLANYELNTKLVLRIPFYCYLRSLSYRDDFVPSLLKIGLYFYKNFIDKDEISIFKCVELFPIGCGNNKEFAFHYLRKAFVTNNESIFVFMSKMIKSEDRHLLVTDGLVKEEQLNIKLDIMKKSAAESLENARPLKKRKY